MGKILIIKGADFSKNAIESVTPIMVTIKTSVTPAGGGTISGGGSYTTGTSVTLTARANSGYVFSKWSDGVTTASRTIIATDGLPTFIAEFIESVTPIMVTIKTSVTPAGGGTISGGGSYTTGTSVTLTARANSGYVFSKWSDGVKTESRTIIATSGLPIFTAEFTEEIPETPETSPIIAMLDVVVELKTDIKKIHINNVGGARNRAAIVVNDQSLMLDSTKVVVSNPNSGIDVSDVGVYTVTGKTSITLHVNKDNVINKNINKWSFGVVDINTMTLVNSWKWNTEDVLVSGLNSSKSYAIIGNFASNNTISEVPIYETDFTIS